MQLFFFFLQKIDACDTILLKFRNRKHGEKMNIKVENITSTEIENAIIQAGDSFSAAQVVKMEMSQRILLDVPYPLWDRVNHALKSLPQLTEETNFGASVEATLLIRKKDLEEVTAKITAITDAKAEWLELDELHYPWPAEDEAAAQA